MQRFMRVIISLRPVSYTHLLPGGVDIEAAKRLGIRVVNGQSLPGRVSPKTSGEFIKEAIYNMMEEV